MLDKLTGVKKLSPKLIEVIANTGWLVADRIVRMAIGLVVVVWVARYLGPAQFGTFNYAVAFTSLFGSVASLGLDQIVVRNIINDPGCKEETLGTAFNLKLLSGLLTTLIIFVLIRISQPTNPDAQILAVVLGSCAIFQAFDVIDFWFQSQVQSKFTVYAKNAAFAVGAIAKVIMIQVHAPLIAFGFATLLEFGLGAIGLIYAYKWNGFTLKLWGFNLQRGLKLLASSWTLILTGLTISIYMRIDQIMLGQMLGNQAVGIYSAATRISEVWYFIPSAITSSVFPAILEAKKTDHTLYDQRLGKLFNVMFLLSLTISVVMTFLAKPSIALLFGAKYDESTPILLVHIWASVFVFLGVAQSCWFMAEDFLMIGLQRTMMGAVINVGLNIWLIPIYGGLGAAIATVIAQAFSVFVLNIFDRRTRKLVVLQVRAILFLPFS
jgi:polysaccharide transporter, PST family